MDVKKVFLVILMMKAVSLSAQQKPVSESPSQRMQKKAEKKRKNKSANQAGRGGSIDFSKAICFWYQIKYRWLGLVL